MEWYRTSIGSVEIDAPQAFGKFGDDSFGVVFTRHETEENRLRTYSVLYGDSLFSFSVCETFS
jgi:hypothetical protein